MKEELTESERIYQENWEITEAMIRFGGSFVKALGNLWRIGDLSNRARLQNAFGAYWNEYAEIVKMKRNDAKNKEWYND